MLRDLVGLVRKQEVVGPSPVLLLIPRVGDSAELDLPVAGDAAPDAGILVEPAVSAKNLPRPVDDGAKLRTPPGAGSANGDGG